MRRANIKMNGLMYKDYLVIEDLADVLEYHKVEFSNKVKLSKEEIEERAKTWYKSHDASNLTNVAEFTANFHETNPLDELTMLHAKVMCDQFKDILADKKLAINKKGGYFSIKPSESPEYEWLSEYKFTSEDIVISKWPGGSHFYAKIGTIDVVDKDGNVKWNARWEARKAAVDFLRTL